jgi:hypothetical protein
MKFNLCLLFFIFSFLTASIAQIDCITEVDEKHIKRKISV